ncbi:MAG: PAS domain S-box protein [Methanoregula sp.]|jgi:PAS domain S-box-containing protein|nr:PAS domain S-box protein [Methanoregula sp.]
MTYSALDITRSKRDHDELRAAYEQLKASDEKLREQYDDITKSEERLRKSEAEIAGILRTAPVSIGLMSADRVFLRVNDRFCEMTGYSTDDLIGHNARFLYPDDTEYARAGTFYSLRSRGDTVGTVETRFVRKDGTLLDILLFGTMIDSSSPPAGNIFIALDITEEKRRARE